MPAAQPPPSPVPATVVRDVTAFARTLVTAARAQQMYGPLHPTAEAAVGRCCSTLAAVAAHEGLTLGITPEALLINGELLPADPRIREAAALLNDHDILRLHIASQPTTEELSNFLMLLSFEPDAIRHRGGPASVWEQYGHYWLVIDQIDYETLLSGAAPGTVTTAGRQDATDAARPKRINRDHIWQSLVRTMADGRAAVEAQGERRLLDIARSPEAIQALAADAAASQPGEGAAREAAQAAAILMTFQRLSSFVEMQTPHDLQAVLDHIADAAAHTDPALLMRVASEAAESGLGADVVKAIGGRFDDDQVANLLAAALAAEGKASARMAAALNTLMPDDNRRGRVLRLARGRAGEAGPSNAGDVSSVWRTLERFLDGPADATYVSRLYGESLEQAEARSNRMRLDAPAKLDEWMRSVSAESMRTLSATVLLDLFSLERDPGAVFDTARDLAVLVDDLLLASDAVEALRVLDALVCASRGGDPERAAAARAGLGDIPKGSGLREILGLAADLDARQYDALERVGRALGPPAASVVVAALSAAPTGTARQRLGALLIALEDDALDALASAIDVASPDQTRELISIVTRIGGVRAVALLNGWARSARTDLMRDAIHGLVTSQEPTARRAVAALLHTGPLGARAAAVEAVASSHHPSASAVLALTLSELDPLGDEHDLCLRILAALRLVGDQDAVPAIAGTMRAWSWRAWGRAGHVKQLAVSVLSGIRTPEARDAIAEAAQHGDFRLKRVARAAMRAGA